MREIKFRAWDDGKMIYPTNALSNMSRFFRVVREDAILMQYTGLKDKNGKEIYEGDILQTVAKDGLRLSKFEVLWQDNVCSFMKHREDGNIYQLCSAQSLLEVIGNIHETPELLIL